MSRLTLILPYILLASHISFSQTDNSVYPLPCYYHNRIIPGGILDLSKSIVSDDSNGDSLRLIASLPIEGGYNRLLMSDCDHNGKSDFIYRGIGAKLYFVENQGSNVFTVVDSISSLFYIPLAVGDFDGDSLTDLAVQEGNFVRVLESNSYNSFPKTIVWSYTLSGPFGEGRFEQYGQMTDLDNDGRKEILMTTNTFPLFSGYGYVSIFENVSDNNYNRIFYYGLNYPNSVLGYISSGDYDNNNKLEFACSAGVSDSLYVFEAVANDTFRLKFKTYTGLTNQYPVVTGSDLDNDGKREIFVSGDNFSQPGFRNIQMYEASSGDAFSLNCTITQFTNLIGFQPVNTGNLFSTGSDELVFEGHRIYIYNATGNNAFTVRDSSLFYASATNSFCFDINPGGYKELQIIRYNGSILVFDNPFVTGIVNINQIPSVFSLYQNYPNPFNPTTKIRFDIGGPAFRTLEVKIIVYDMLGHEITTLVNESLQPGSYETQWNASEYSSGIYFFRLVTPQYEETRQMVLIK
jgi:type IX secretion system substrate protein